MAFARRLQKELVEIRDANLPYFTDVEVDESNILVWRGLLVPINQPYNKGAFIVEFNFPPEYPFKPPQVMFRTKIYHPNIGEDGQICMPLLSPENWKPSTKIDQVIEALVAMVNSPEPEHPLRPELAEELVKNKKKFFRVAEEFTVKFAERRAKESTTSTVNSKN